MQLWADIGSGDGAEIDTERGEQAFVVGGAEAEVMLEPEVDSRVGAVVDGYAVGLVARESGPNSLF